MSVDEGELSTIDDLIARAELEPTLADVYVEGRSDVHVIQLVLASRGVDAAVFAVNDRLFIERGEVEVFTDTYGNRAKLEAAAARLDSHFGAAGHSYSFVIDSDWATVRGPMPLRDSSLLLTDYPSMEHYFYFSTGLQYLISSGLGKSEVDVEQLRLRLQGALRDIAAARLVLEEVHVACIPKFVSLCDFTETDSRADAREIVSRSINAVGLKSILTRDEVDVRVVQYRTWLELSDHPGRGHDIAPVLIASLGLKGEFAKGDVIEAMMRSTLVPSNLAAQPLFERIAERVQGEHQLAA